MDESGGQIILAGYISNQLSTCFAISYSRIALHQFSLTVTESSIIIS
uniref:Uncharacterized protein n=1 Tax=Podoviridae sp. ctG4L18 TaxID=2825234 RepID=A0A8S5UPG8_9CAUD|nr:MAG TPA: hypothetical protein [Podoviridae sp. ctG4L18]